MFYDLNIQRPRKPQTDAQFEEIISALQRFDYRGIAITTFLEEYEYQNIKAKKKQKKDSDKEKDIVPPPYDTTSIKNKFPKITFFNRITLSISDTSNIHRLVQCRNLKKYDLIAIQPENQNVLKALQTVHDMDILSYNPETKCTLQHSRKLYNVFVQRDVFFELAYSPAILDATARKNTISISHTYHAAGKSKNIIITSGASSAGHIRSPYDIINLSLLFGLSEQQAKQVITRNCEKLLLKARKQRRGKNAIEMYKVPQSEAMNVDDTPVENAKE